MRKIPRAILYRLCAATVLLLLAASFFAPAYVLTDQGALLPEQVDRTSGWGLAEMSWLGPLRFTVAWWAHLPLLFTTTRMVRGQAPGPYLTGFGTILALTVLLPQRVFNSELGSWHIGHVDGPAVWIWLGGFAVTTAAAIFLARAEPAV